MLLYLRPLISVREQLSADSALKIHMCKCFAYTFVSRLACFDACLAADHGQGRIKDPSDLAAFDIVVTTYQTLAADYAKRDANDAFPPLGSIHWHRVLLDEAHLVKAVKSQQSAACIALHADRRWCCTGTPIGTDVADLFGQVCLAATSDSRRRMHALTPACAVFLSSPVATRQVVLL